MLEAIWSLITSACLFMVPWTQDTIKDTAPTFEVLALTSGSSSGLSDGDLWTGRFEG
ncbi:hypothetical protein NDU88_003272, partial [Pleurodeles waltl]